MGLSKLILGMYCAVLLLFATSSFAHAGQQYCNDDADTFYVERIPFGYAFVRGAYADYCKKDISEDNAPYVCDGNPDYSPNFEQSGSDLAVTISGVRTLYKACKFDNPNAYDPN